MLLLKNLPGSHIVQSGVIGVPDTITGISK